MKRMWVGWAGALLEAICPLLLLPSLLLLLLQLCLTLLAYLVC